MRDLSTDMIAEVCREAAEYCEKRGIGLLTLSRRALGNTYGIERMARKAAQTDASVKALRAFMENDMKNMEETKK